MQLEDENVLKSLKLLRLQMLATHVFCFFAEIFPHFTTELSFNKSQVLIVFAMVLQVCNITKILDYLAA
jgi:hypothetical protein